LATKGQSVVEEKGEGFENGKLFVGWSGLPSTSSPFNATSQDLIYWIIKALCIQNKFRKEAFDDLT
jgi:hypothetical protein